MRPAQGAAPRKIKIGPGEHYVTQKPGEVIITVLGSCVAACIRDPLAKVGGMNHFMLPESSSGTWGQSSATMRYGNFAMEQLVNDILRAGGMRSRLEVKVFGGAAMISGGAAIGHQNADFVETYLQDEGMPIAARHLRGGHARRIDYDPLSGKVMMLEMSMQSPTLQRSERSAFQRVQTQPKDDDIELFD